MTTRYPFPEYQGAPTSWYNQYLNESMGIGDYFNYPYPSEDEPAAEYGMTSEELEEELRRLDRQRLAGVMDSRRDTGPLFTPSSMIERQFARAVEEPTRAATRGLREAVPPVSLLQDQIVDPTDLLPQQSTTLIGSRSVDRSPADIKSIGRRVKAKKTKQRAKNPADLGDSPTIAPQAPAALLDTAEPSAEPNTSWYDDPMRMGLIQAGLGLLSAPQYSTNMNDVAFFPTAARGIGGFLQGYGGTKERLEKEERQKLEDDYKRSQIEFDKLYKTALTNEAIGRTEQMQALLEQPAKELQKYREEVIELFPDPTNQTRQYLFAAGPTEGRKILAKFANAPALNETQRADLLNLINNSKALTDDQKKALRGMANERDQDGKLSSNYNSVLSAVRQEEEKNAPAKPAAGPKLDDNSRILLAEGANEDDPQVQMAFNALYGLKGSKVETVYDAKTGAQTSKRVYPEIEEYVRNRFPKLAAARDQVAAQAEESTKRPSQQVLEAQALIGEMNQIEDEIQKVGADIPMATGDYLQNQVVGSIPLAGKYFQSDTFRRNEGLQNEWIVLVLRQESGAAIGQDEYDNYRSIYFPIAGDSESVVNAKRRARARAQQERAMIASGEAPPKKPEDFANGHANMFGLTPIQVDQPTVQDPSVEGLKIRNSQEHKQYD